MSARFVVHEHHARRLHWDFRLEMDGTLKSWAIPKGPSMDPKDKRLAVQVEDHELSYIGFEGHIAEGEYGAGDVRVWDSGSFNEVGGALSDGKLEFTLDGGKLKGTFALVRLKKGKATDWLLIKKRDANAIDGWVIKSAI